VGSRRQTPRKLLKAACLPGVTRSIILMDLKKFNDRQKQALLDLAMLAMYADGHLTFSEDERVLRLLTAMGFTAEYDRERHFDASVSRVSRHSTTSAAARAHAATLAKAFTTPEQHQQVQAILNDVVSSDRNVSPQESKFLSAVKEALDKAA
jgi:tellurite resistance protein TerB